MSPWDPAVLLMAFPLERETCTLVQQKSYPRMLMAAIFITGPNWTQYRGPSMGEGHCGSSIRTVECCSAMMKCGELTQATTWVTVPDFITLREA